MSFVKRIRTTQKEASDLKLVLDIHSAAQLLSPG